MIIFLPIYANCYPMYYVQMHTHLYVFLLATIHYSKPCTNELLPWLLLFYCVKKFN